MGTNEAVLRWTVPIDGAWYLVTFAGDIVHVATRHDHVIEFWTLAHLGQDPKSRRFRVFGTGHRIPVPWYAHRGTAFTEGGALVWHLIEDLSAVSEAA